jgi:hypothetical protein
MLALLWVLAAIVVGIALAYANAPGIAWAAGIVVLIAAGWLGALPAWLALAFAAAFVLLAPALLIPALRRKLVSEPVLRAFRKVIPPM